MAEAHSAELSSVLDSVIAAAPDCIRAGVLLKAVDWRAVPPDAVARMLGRIAAADMQLTLWVVEALLLAGHRLGDAARRDQPPVLRALDIVNALAPGDAGAAAGLEAAVAALIVKDTSQSAALNALLRRLCDKGLAQLAAPLVIRAWPHASQGGVALRAAVRRETEAYPPVALRLLCLSNADVLGGDFQQALAAVIRFEDGAAHIDSLLMSYRVIGRRVEQAFFADLIGRATLRGADRVCGVYRPTGRNGIVRDFYASVGFDGIEENGQGSTWLLPLIGDLGIAALPAPVSSRGEAAEQGACIR